MTQQTWLITGVSSGLGKALAEAVLAEGHKVIGSLRSAQQVAAFEASGGGRAFGLLLDLATVEPVDGAVDEAIRRAGGRLDVLVNNAGVGLMGALEELDERDYRAAMEINYFGPVRMAKAVVTRLREQGAGVIVNISSMAGFVGNAGGSAYCGSKFALEGFSEALAQELAPFGVKVVIVEPGAFRTEFASAKLPAPQNSVAAYSGSLAGDINAILRAYDGAQPGDPVRAAAAIMKVAQADEPPLRLALGEDALEWMSTKLGQVERDLTSWKDVTVGTSFVETADA